MILLFLIMRCTPTIRELIEATPLSLFSPSATSLSALAPRSGLERSDFVHWHKAKCRLHRAMSEFEGKAENICSH